jgi:DNA-binding beta-propeller fold protein YncE
MTTTSRLALLPLLSTLVLAGCPAPEDAPCSPGPGQICTFAGTGVSGLTPDELDPLETEFYLPQDMTVGPDGNVYLLDWNNHRVRVIEDGQVHTLIGTGSLGDAPDGVALETSLNHPTHIAFSPTGELILSAWHNSKVMSYDFAAKTVTAVCGTGKRAFNGDGLEGIATDLDLPVGTAFAPDGGMYISDQANQRIRLLKDGMVTTVVGVGTPGYSGDGGPAIDAEINLPVSQSAAPAGRIATDPNGVIYLADTLNHAIRKIDADGIITTLAGTGTPGNGGDGVAIEQALNNPTDVATDFEGNVYIADTYNSCIRKVSPDGQMIAAVGICGDAGYEGDGGMATEAKLDRPYGVEVDSDGTIYVADTHNHVLRIVYPE